MVARIYAIFFVALLVVGFIYQESYMQMSLSEFSQKIDTDRLPYEIFSMTPLQVQQFKDGELTGELSAAEGRLVTTGRFTAQGNVRLRTVDSNADPADRIAYVTSEKLVATTQKSSGAPLDLFSGGAKFERLEIPGPATLASRGHVAVGRAFSLDVSNMTLVTKEPVTVTAVGRKIEAQGMEFEMRNRSFKFAGPVRGSEIPPARPAKIIKNKRAGERTKRTRAKGG
ncbi:MAG: hypothetical protein ACO3A4_13965 [Silvanigrellaceae bacterium]